MYDCAATTAWVITGQAIVHSKDRTFRIDCEEIDSIESRDSITVLPIPNEHCPSTTMNLPTRI